jgi:hypothetical protein
MMVEGVARKVLEYCQSNNWAGYDPYDALNSRVFRALPFLDIKWVRLAMTQAMKRSPINFRPLFLVPKTSNPKGLALILSSVVKLSRSGSIQGGAELDDVAALLLAARSKGSANFCWGYSFDWQTRTKLVPAGSPNVVCTTFAANALLDAYEATGLPDYRDAAVSAAQFVLEQLYCEEGGLAWFNYTPLERVQVHNANLLGAALLCRAGAYAPEHDFVPPALRAARFSVDRQNPDGSWYYGERISPSQKWIDNFHTGFNLCGIRNVGIFAKTDEFESCLKRGFEFFLENFFESDGAPKYFHDQKYPLDVHSVAQGIITLVTLSDLNATNLDLAHSIFQWSLENLWDDRGYFYYQQHRFWTNRIPYLRWGQAWILLALATLLEARGGNGSVHETRRPGVLREALP